MRQIGADRSTRGAANSRRVPARRGAEKIFVAAAVVIKRRDDGASAASRHRSRIVKALEGIEARYKDSRLLPINALRMRL
jgi:hypothetical protein